MDVTLDADESAAIEKALRSYVSDLRMEIVDTDNPGYRRDLRAERELLEGALAKLDRASGTATGGAPADASGDTFVRLIAVWAS